MSGKSDPASPIYDHYSGISGQAESGVRFSGRIEGERQGNMPQPAEGTQALRSVSTRVGGHDNKFDVAPVL